LSREWHAFLGFKVYSAANSHAQSVASNGLKRRYSVLGEIDVNINTRAETKASENAKFKAILNETVQFELIH
jgi:hypothetical protein